jgi:hypothetical protein
MEINIQSAEHFNKLLDALAGDIIDGELYFKLYKDLNEQIPQYTREFNESRTFWSLTRKALIDATLLRLCRVYDTTTESLSLCNLLDTIKVNLNIFDVEHFRDRLKDNPFVESLASTAVKPNIKELEQNIYTVSVQDPLVKSLVIWRHNIIAHTTAANVVNDIKVTDKYNITYNEISVLLNRATTILNKYSYLFRASTYSTQAIGHDDYLQVLNAIKYHLDNLYT